MTHGDELTLFNPDDGEEEIFVDEFNEVKDLRRGRKKKTIAELRGTFGSGPIWQASTEAIPYAPAFPCSGVGWGECR